MTQVDLGLTNVSRFDLADSAINVNDANKKPGASQTANQPRNNRTVGVSTSRFNTITANTSESIGYFKPVEYATDSPIS
jgi:hypothetical protein